MDCIKLQSLLRTLLWYRIILVALAAPHTASTPLYNFEVIPSKIALFHVCRFVIKKKKSWQIICFLQYQCFKGRRSSKNSHSRSGLLLKPSKDCVTLDCFIYRLLLKNQLVQMFGDGMDCLVLIDTCRFLFILSHFR